MIGSRPVRLMGLFIVIISAVFIMLIVDLLMNVNVACLVQDDSSVIRCGMSRFSTDIVFGLALVVLFSFLTITAVYLMKNNPTL